MLVAYDIRALSRLIQDSCVLLSLHPQQRVLPAMVQLARDHPRAGRPGMIDLRLTHTDIGDLIGTRREVVLKALKSLAARGLVWRERGRYVVAKHLLDETPRSSAPRPSSAGYACDEHVRTRLHRSVSARHSFGLPLAKVQVLIEEAELRAYDAGETMGTSAAFQVTMLLEGSARVMVDLSPTSVVGA